MDEFDQKTINQFLLIKQHLTEESKTDDIMQTIRDLGGLHATSATTPYISLFTRCNNFTRDQLDAEIFRKRTLGRIRYVRKTVFLIPKEFLSTAFSGTQKMNQPVVELYQKYLGLSEKEINQTSKMILKILKGRGLTTKEIRNELKADQNLWRIINLMCDRGQLIRESNRISWKSNLHTYYIFNEYFPDINLNEFSETAAKKRIIQQYLTSYGPTTITDIAWWAGFTKTEVKRELSEITEDTSTIKISNLSGEFYILRSDLEHLIKMQPSNDVTINLLPFLDPYIMGYKERERYLDRKFYDYIFDRSGNSTNTILVDGKISGVWDVYEKPVPIIKLYFLTSQEQQIMKKTKKKAKELGKFITDDEVKTKVCKKMVPLPKRTAGSMMTPLRDY